MLIFSHSLAGYMSAMVSRYLTLLDFMGGIHICPEFSLGAFESEARAAGARSLRIVGHEIQNTTFFRNRALADKLGFRFNQIDNKTFEIIKDL